MLPWRNWLARKTVNLEVGGSSPPGSVVLKYDFKLFKNAFIFQWQKARLVNVKPVFDSQ